MRQYLPTYENCFGCGKANSKSLGLRFFVEGDEVKALFRPQEEHSGYEGIVHGGILCALMDECMGWAPTVKKGLMGIAAEVTIRFLKPVPTGATYIASARLCADKRRLWLTEGQLHDSAGQLYLKAKGKYMPISKEATRRVDQGMTYQEGDLRVFHYL